MATADVINATIDQLTAMAAPTTNAALQALLTQRDSLLAQLATVQTQIDAAEGSEGKLAKQAAQILQQVLPNRVPGLGAAMAASRAAAAAPPVTPAP